MVSSEVSTFNHIVESKNSPFSWEKCIIKALVQKKRQDKIKLKSNKSFLAKIGKSAAEKLEHGTI